MDLDAVVIPADTPPDGMTLSEEGTGPATLEQLPLSQGTAAALLAAPGFVDGRWGRFAGSADDPAASKGFILTWAVQYASLVDGARVMTILRTELESDDHYGWGHGEDAGLGDEGTCRECDNPQLGGHETICLWRRGSLVMVAGGGSDNDTPIQESAQAMDAGAANLSD